MILRRLWIASACLSILGVLVVLQLIDARRQAAASRAKGRLSHVWTIVEDYAQQRGVLPPTATTNPQAGTECSWRAILMKERTTPDIKSMMSAYRFDQDWNSSENTQCAITLARAYNYFADDDALLEPIASIQALVDAETIWQRAASVDVQALAHRADQIVLVMVPESHVGIFEPRDISKNELRELIRKYKHVYAFCADRSFRVLREPADVDVP